MTFLLRLRIVLICMVLLVLVFVWIFGIRNNANEVTQYSDCVVGLLSDGDVGSKLIVYTTDTWTPSELLELPDVTPDNYAAISNNGKYVAITTWSSDYSRRYLMVYSTANMEWRKYYENLPPKQEIIEISWLSDNKTLLFLVRDATSLPYYEIRTFDIESEEEKTLVKGEVWQVRTFEESGTTADDFYLKGAAQYLRVKYKSAANESGEWNYYLGQSDIDDIYSFYGGVGDFDISDIPNRFYVEFSRPRASPNADSIVYSATLIRNSAYGEHTPLWICSAIWNYNIKTGEADIIYKQTDGGAIGRVDWMSEKQLGFVSYYDYQGGRDSINIYNFDSDTSAVIFPYTNENYNNVTLLPIGRQKLTFTSSSKNASYDESHTIEYNLSTNEYEAVDVQFNQKTILLEKFIYNPLMTRKDE